MAGVRRAGLGIAPSANASAWGVAHTPVLAAQIYILMCVQLAAQTQKMALRKIPLSGTALSLIRWGPR
eukprot:11849766-Karenia_brevis.AAC.1